MGDMTYPRDADARPAMRVRLSGRLKLFSMAASCECHIAACSPPLAAGCKCLKTSPIELSKCCKQMHHLEIHTEWCAA